MISKYLLQFTNVRVVQILKNRDFAHECGFCLVGVRLVIVRSHAPDLVFVDHFDGVPLASSARDGFHDGGERAFAKFMADIIVRVYASLRWAGGSVAIDKAYTNRGIACPVCVGEV